MGAILHYLETMDTYSTSKISDILTSTIFKKNQKQETGLTKTEILEQLFDNSGLDIAKHNREYFEKTCLEITASKLKIKVINWENDSEEDIINIIYNTFIAGVQRQLAKQIKKTNLQDIPKNTEDLLKTEGKVLTASGLGLTATLAAGEAAGFTLFTSSAVGLKALGMLLGTTFSFSTYSTTMVVLGAVFGPAGFTVAGGVLAAGGIKSFISRKRNKVYAVMLKIIVDLIANKETRRFEMHQEYGEYLLDESKRLLPKEISKYLSMGDRK
jgi:hypothetical protein